MLMVWGNHDGKGDDVMVVKDQARLAKEYCSQGVPVQTQEIQGADHSQAGASFIPAAEAWLASRFAGVQAPSSCAS